MGSTLSRSNIDTALSDLWNDSTTWEQQKLLETLDQFLVDRHHYGVSRGKADEYKQEIHDLERDIKRLEDEADELRSLLNNARDKISEMKNKA